MSINSKLMLMLFTLVTFATSVAAVAAQAIPDNRDRMPVSPGMAVSNAEVPMSSAILKVESRYGGKAVMARLFSAPNGPVYLISVENPDGRGVIDVQVDADSGKIAPEPDPMLLKDFVKHRSGV